MANEKQKNIYQKIMAVREELLKTKLKKSGENKFAHFKYFELDDILPTIIQLCVKHQLYTHFDIEENQAKLTIVDMESKDEVEFVSPMILAELKGTLAIQNLGATHTYMKRYLYFNAFEICEIDLLDQLAGSPQVEKSIKEGKEKPTTSADTPPQKGKSKNESKLQDYIEEEMGGIKIPDAPKKQVVIDILAQAKVFYQKKQPGLLDNYLQLALKTHKDELDTSDKKLISEWKEYFHKKIGK